MVYKKKNRNALISFITSLLDVIIPRNCTSCETNLNLHEYSICINCLEKLKRADEELLNREYSRKFAAKQFISEFASLYLFEKDKEMQNIIHSVKYKGRFLTAGFLGMKTGEELRNKISSWNIDIIIPIPLHHLKTAERGYNQSFYIAKGISKTLGIPLNNKLIKRYKYTLTQTLMTLPERELNISGAFLLKNKVKIKGLNILLVDDVITTGATINECGKVLKAAGAARVFAVSAAIAE